jgi:hypothetical protein
MPILAFEPVPVEIQAFVKRREVDELLYVYLEKREVKWMALVRDGEYQQVQPSGLVDLGVAEVSAHLGWA